MVEDRNQPTQTIRALAVGRLVPVKNFELLLRAWNDVEIPLDIVGDGPLRQNLASAIKANELSDRVSLLGHQYDVLDRMERSEIVVISSVREGFGYVTLEALQSRCVVVSTKCGVAEDLLPPHYLVENNATDLVAVLRRVIEDLPNAIREFEPIWIQAKDMTVARMVRETIAVYEGLVDKPIQ